MPLSVVKSWSSLFGPATSRIHAGAAEIETASARQQLQALGLPLRGSDNPAQFALRALADGTVISEVEAAYTTVRTDEGWRVAVCIVKPAADAG